MEARTSDRQVLYPQAMYPTPQPPWLRTVSTEPGKPR